MLTAHDISNRVAIVFVLGRYEYVTRFYCTRHVVLLPSRHLSRLSAGLVCPSTDPFVRESRLVSWHNDQKILNIPNWLDSRTDIDPEKKKNITKDITFT